MTYRAVVLVLLRAELVLRIGQRIGGEAVELGGEGHLLELQLADLLHGVDGLRDLVLRDYARPATDARLGEALSALQGIPTEQLTFPERVAADLGFEHLDAHVRPLGVRLLSQVPRLPESVRDAAAMHFEDFQALLVATVERLNQVEGIGRTRALELRRFFDRLLESK
jgi:diadenylate cyclase